MSDVIRKASFQRSLILAALISMFAVPASAYMTCTKNLTDLCGIWPDLSSCKTRIESDCEQWAQSECGSNYRSYRVQDVQITAYCTTGGMEPLGKSCAGTCVYQCDTSFDGADCFSTNLQNCQNYCNGTCRLLGEDKSNCQDDHCYACDESTNEEPNDTPSVDEDQCCDTPIIIDIDRRSVMLTDPDDGVYFDLDADGALERVAWTHAGSLDGLLALDRDGNGLIDSGAELFGNRTEQPVTEEPHGFLALAVFDALEAGGNEDGVISAADGVFEHLRLWVDSNHDGFSAAEELHALDAIGVRWISVDFVESRRSDRYGNLFRYHSLVGLTSGQRSRAWDVILLTE